MRTTLSVLIVASVLSASHVVAAAGQATKYGVTVTEGKADILAKAKTYTWTAGQPAFDKNVDAQIIAAVDSQLKTLGLTKLTTGQGDVQVTYASLARTDADVKAAPSPTGALPTYAVGVLVVQMRASAGGQMLFNAKVNTPIDTDRAKLEGAINAAAAAIFEQYPTRTAKKR